MRTVTRFYLLIANLGNFAVKLCLIVHCSSICFCTHLNLTNFFVGGYCWFHHST